MSLEKRVSNLEAVLDRKKTKYIIFWPIERGKETSNWKEELSGDLWIHTSSQEKLNEIKQSIEEIGKQPFVINVVYSD